MTDRGGSTPGSIWADGSKDARLRELHAEGASFRAIGAELGCSRNSAIGRAMRIGLGSKTPAPRARKSSRISANHAAVRIERAKAAAVRAAKPKHNQTLPELLAKRSAGVETFRDRFADESGGITANAFDARIPKRQRKTIYQLDNMHCRWPVGDPGTRGFYFCGGMHAEGLPYCHVHSRRAYSGRK